MNKILIILCFFVFNCFSKEVSYMYVKEYNDEYKVNNKLSIEFKNKHLFSDRIDLEEFIDDFYKLVKLGNCKDNNEDFEHFVRNDKTSCSKDFLINDSSNKKEEDYFEYTNNYSKETYRILEHKKIKDFDFLILEKLF